MASLSPEKIRAPEQAVEFVVARQKSSYQQVLDLYRRTESENPGDVSFRLAQCKFIQRFAWTEDLEWADVAGKDLDACRTSLGKDYTADPEAALYLLEQRFGAEAVAYGEPLVAHSTNWSTAQRARLHAALSRGYAAVKNDTRAGQEAVLAVQLDPANDRLIDAMRYLARTGRTRDAGKMLAAAPVAKAPWQEAQRINTAAEVLPGTQANDELHRAQRAGLKIDAYTTARVLQHAGDSAGAEMVLAADTASRKFESPQNRQLRLEVAFDAGDAKAAADIIREQYEKTGKATQLAYAYAHLLGLSPALAARADLLPLAAGLLGTAAFFLAAPGLLLFPVHYRGTVRQRKGKVCAPLFARIGLRHAWWGLAVFSTVLYFVTIFRMGTAALSPTGSGVVRIDASSRIAISHLWALFFSGLGLAAVGRLLTLREWIGSGRWKLAWMLLPVAAYSIYRLLYLLARHNVQQGFPSNSWTVSLAHGALALGGIALALFVLSVLVPVIEELVFRGCLLGGLSRHISFGWANIVQAAIFAGMHEDKRYFIYLFVMGLIAGWLTRKTKGLSIPILLHAINNAIFVFGVAAA
ncbi:CPBP family intramembrane glutamic endopeptidase [Paraburkholderia rhynchosiae]|uniref:CPBP family intramembrane glutamic endopeptidase n=1 Tax=Paraburkholderia rhynchosiae TaxID=487049 RepID=UPI001FC98F08|nr:CPBP family intramembrane glutamic endopeptidase [Paraburkholderia rhynchosiae]